MAAGPDHYATGQPAVIYVGMGWALMAIDSDIAKRRVPGNMVGVLRRA